MAPTCTIYTCALNTILADIIEKLKEANKNVELILLAQGDLKVGRETAGLGYRPNGRCMCM
jgi:hypothetical protein